MPTPPVPIEKARAVLDQYHKLRAQGANVTEAARAIGIPRPTLQGYIRREKDGAGEWGPKWEPREAIQFTPVPDVDDIDDLIEQRKRHFARKKAHEEASKLIPVRVKIPGPIGICHFGDPHIDDDGTDIEALERDTATCRDTEGMFAANLGDTTNNWVGRLARLYADQSTSAKQAWMLAEWFVKRCHWLYMIAGNHDAWSGAGDPLKWISRQHAEVYQSSEVRIGLDFPNGRKVVVNGRHDFSGSSQWNPAHGAMKAIQMGLRDHITIHGHKHVSGLGVIKDPDSGRICHAIPVASYKLFDRYAKERGFRDQHISPSVVTIIDPALPETSGDMIKVFFDVQEGADYLAWKRRKAA